MTTIAWDGKTMAADRMGSSDGLTRQRKKLHRITYERNQALVAFAGVSAFNVRALEYLKGGQEKPSWEKYGYESPGSEIGLMVIERRLVYLISADFTLVPITDRLVTLGRGAEVAIGALEAGASARRAVEIAAKRTCGTGLGVDEMGFE